MIRGGTKTLSTKGKYLEDNIVVTSSRLPNKYQEVEYLQSSGTQYIDTGVNASGVVGIKYEASPTFLSSVSNSNCLIGGHVIYNDEGSNTTRYVPFFVYNTNNNVSYANKNIYSSGTTAIVGQTYIGDFNYLNSKKINISTYSGEKIVNNASLSLNDSVKSNGKDLILFRWVYNDSLVNIGLYKLFNLKISNKATIIRNFVPCYRKSDSVAGLYDTVNDVFYTNSGSGSFILGPDVN